MVEEHVCLPVGYFGHEGGQVNYEVVEGARLAEIDGRISSPDAKGGHVMMLRERLYGSPGGGPYVVHMLLELSGGEQPLLGRLERFERWSEVMMHHPDLARSAGYRKVPEPAGGSPERTLATPTAFVAANVDDLDEADPHDGSTSA